MKNSFIKFGFLILFAVVVIGFSGCGEKEVVEEDDLKVEEMFENADSEGVDLVWYEVPELGVKFKVTSGAKSDLIYKQSTDSKAIYICNKNLTKFLKEENIFAFDVPVTEDDFFECSLISGYYYKENKDKIEGEYSCMAGQVIGSVNNDNICFKGPQAVVVSKDLMEKYLETVNDEGRKAVIGTIHQIIKETMQPIE